MPDAIDALLTLVANDLAWLPESPVFIGGMTIGLFLDAFGRSQQRSTEDIDCIVPTIATRAAWIALEAQLRARGWSPDRSGPICRYTSPKGLKVDLLPEKPEILGFGGRWFQDAILHARQERLATGTVIRILQVEYLLALKLVAFLDRGRQDPMMSQDLEDIASLLDGNQELEARVTGAPNDLRQDIATGFHDIMHDHRTFDTLLAQLPRGDNTIGRDRRVKALAQRLANLSSPASP